MFGKAGSFIDMFFFGQKQVVSVEKSGQGKRLNSFVGVRVMLKLNCIRAEWFGIRSEHVPVLICSMKRRHLRINIYGWQRLPIPPRSVGAAACM